MTATTSRLRTAQLSDSRSGGRATVYDPATRILSICVGRRATVYRVTELHADAAFGSVLALKFTKVGPVKGHYNVTLSADPRACSCDCRGKDSGSAERANERAMRRGEKATDSLGCKHLDAAREGLAAGWFGADPRANPEADAGSTDVDSLDAEMDALERAHADAVTEARMFREEEAARAADDLLPECFRGMCPESRAGVPF